MLFIKGRMDKKIFILVFILMFLAVPFISAEIGFDNVMSNHDEKTQTVTIKNTFGLGKDLVTIKLITPLNYIEIGRASCRERV